MLHVSERKKLYAFLAALFSYPDEELISLLDRGEGRAVAGLLPDAPSPAWTEGENRLEGLQSAFTESFVNRLGGAPAPPYGSVYLEDEECLMGATTLSVAQAYREEGLAVEASVEPPDYLATELEFLYYLVSREEEALREGAAETARAGLRKQAEFSRTLFHPWIPEFCRRLRDDPRTDPLYHWGAELLERFCVSERDWLERLA